MRFRFLTVVCVTGLALTGCSAKTDSAAPAGQLTTAPSSSSAPALTGVEVTASASEDLTAEPKVEITPGDPASALVIKDIVTGTGEAVAAGQTVTAHYVGYGAATGAMFDSSWMRGEPATFPLDNVILGWQEGLVGMQAGGRRLLIIPAELGYGDTPPPGSGIEPGETLIFVVDLVSFQ